MCIGIEHLSSVMYIITPSRKKHLTFFTRCTVELGPVTLDVPRISDIDFVMLHREFQSCGRMFILDCLYHHNPVGYIFPVFFFLSVYVCTYKPVHMGNAVGSFTPRLRCHLYIIVFISTWPSFFHSASLRRACISDVGLYTRVPYFRTLHTYAT